MTDPRVLPFPSDDSGSETNDAQMTSRFQSLYASTPVPESSQVDRCIAAVLADAVHPRVRSVPGRSTGRWWWGAAAAAAVITATTFSWTRNTPSAIPVLTEASAVSVVEGAVTNIAGNGVRFDLKIPSAANEVAIVGDFNGWDEDATPMSKRNGAWSANVPLKPGRHVYAFVIDGKRWVIDPLAPQVPDDGYGPSNAVIIDGGPL